MNIIQMCQRRSNDKSSVAGDPGVHGSHSNIIISPYNITQYFYPTNYWQIYVPRAERLEISITYITSISQYKTINIISYLYICIRFNYSI